MENVMKDLLPQNISNMKIDVEKFIELLNNKEAILVDIRMPFETAVWGLNFGLKIPANELPDNLEKLPKDKLIVVACPKTDRSIMARTYLAALGYETKYLSGGILGLVERLKGGKAKDIDLKS